MMTVFVTGLPVPVPVGSMRTRNAMSFPVVAAEMTWVSTTVAAGLGAVTAGGTNPVGTATPAQFPVTVANATFVASDAAPAGTEVVPPLSESSVMVAPSSATTPPLGVGATVVVPVEPVGVDVDGPPGAIVVVGGATDPVLPRFVRIWNPMATPSRAATTSAIFPNHSGTSALAWFLESWSRAASVRRPMSAGSSPAQTEGAAALVERTRIGIGAATGSVAS